MERKELLTKNGAKISRLCQIINGLETELYQWSAQNGPHKKTDREIMNSEHFFSITVKSKHKNVYSCKMLLTYL